jgi:hypothetical protein
MPSQKQIAVIEDLSSCINSLTRFSLEYLLTMDQKNSTIPSEDIEEPIVKILKFVVRTFKEDFQNIYKLYRTEGLWKKAIREVLSMDDRDEKGYWFYHAYGIQPNILLEIYMEEHFPIALEKILEMFERGYRKDFLNLKIDPKKIKKMDFFDYGINEIINIIDERHERDRIRDAKDVGRFFAWLYTLDKIKIEKKLQSYESVVDENLQEIASVCRYTLEHEAKEQLELSLSVT